MASQEAKVVTYVIIKSDILQVMKQIFLGGFKYCKWPGALYQHQILIIWNPFYDLLCADNKTQSSDLQTILSNPKSNNTSSSGPSKNSDMFLF